MDGQCPTPLFKLETQAEGKSLMIGKKVSGKADWYVRVNVMKQENSKLMMKRRKGISFGQCQPRPGTLDAKGNPEQVRVN